LNKDDGSACLVDAGLNDEEVKPVKAIQECWFRKISLVVLDAICQVYQRQRYNFAFFFVIGMVCMLLMLFGEYLPFGKDFPKFFQGVYGEHLAYRSILVAFIGCYFMVFVSYIKKGPRTYKGSSKHSKAFLVVSRPARFGEDLCCVAAAVSAPLSLAVTICTGAVLAAVGYLIGLLILALLFRGMPWLVYNKDFQSGNIRFDRVLYFIGALVAVFAVWYAAGPMSKAFG
jgi:hypothetical protein